MEDRSFAPVVFLANACQDEKYRPHRSNRTLDILERLDDSLMDSGQMQVIRSDPEKGIFFLDFFRKFKYDKTVTVVHLIGSEHTCRNGWEVQTGMGTESLDPRKFSGMLSGLPELKLVILSGCAYPGMLQMLMGLDIPAVLVTDELSENPLTFDIVDHFYHSLSQQYSIRESFDRARTLFPYKYQYRETAYDLDLDQFTWQSFLAEEVPWGLYYLTENARQLTSKMPAPPPHVAQMLRKHKPVLVEPVTEVVVASPPAEQEELIPLPFLKWSLALMVFAVAFILSFDSLEWILPTNFQAPDQQENQDGRFNIKMFPLVQYPDCEATDPAYTQAIWKNLAEIAETDSQFLNITFEEVKDCPEAHAQAEEWIRTGKAHMVFWGNYAELPTDQVQVQLRSLYVRKRDTLNPMERNDLQINAAQEWFAGYTDASFPKIKSLIHFAVGTYLYDKHEYESSLQYLSKIQLSEDTSYIRVDRLMARSYMALNKYDRAARRYEHILSIQPGNAHAYLERGKMFASIGKYDDALTNYERAIYFEPSMAPAYKGRASLYMDSQNYEAAIMDVKEMTQLEPDDPLGYGMLANLYALQGNKALFFRYMETALRKGYPPQQFIDSPACKKYRYKASFQALIEAYQH